MTEVNDVANTAAASSREGIDVKRLFLNWNPAIDVSGMFNL
jgi:hypothetical protein